MATLSFKEPLQQWLLILPLIFNSAHTPPCCNSHKVYVNDALTKDIWVFMGIKIKIDDSNDQIYVKINHFSGMGLANRILS